MRCWLMFLLLSLYKHTEKRMFPCFVIKYIQNFHIYIIHDVKSSLNQLSKTWTTTSMLLQTNNSWRKWSRAAASPPRFTLLRSKTESSRKEAGNIWAPRNVFINASVHLLLLNLLWIRVEAVNSCRRRRSVRLIHANVFRLKCLWSRRRRLRSCFYLLVNWRRSLAALHLPELILDQLQVSHILMWWVSFCWSIKSFLRLKTCLSDRSFVI